MGDDLEVVNDRDEVVEVRPREEVIRNGLLHRSVHVLVFDRRKRLLVHRRADDKLEYPGLWDGSAAGHVEVGESYFEAAKRELAEELGLTAYPVFLRTFRASKTTCFEFAKLYLVRNVRRRDVRWTDEEFTDVRWLALDEVERDMKRTKYAPNFKLFFRWYQEVFGT